MRPFGGLPRHGELGHGGAEVGGLVDVLDVLVVVARQGRALGLGESGHEACVGRGVARLAAADLVQASGDLLVVHAARPPMAEVQLDVAVLPLAGRVVHHREHGRHRMLGQGRQAFGQVVGGGLAAPMDAVVGLEHAGRLGRHQAIRQPTEVLPIARHVGVVGAHAQGIEHRGHAHREAGRIVGHRRRDGVPVDVRTREEMALQRVGVQIDHPRHEHVAVEVLADRSHPAIDRGDHPVLDQNRADEVVVTRHHARVAKRLFQNPLLISSRSSRWGIR